MYSWILIPLLAAMFLAINMGGSGTAAAFSSAYGANLIRKDLIPGLFGGFVLLGALFAGKEVTLTIGQDIVPEAAMGFVIVTIVLLSIAFSMFFANILRVPQSTSQSTIFALIGVGMVQQDIQSTKLLFVIVPSWIILPLLSFFITLLVGKFIYRPVQKKNRTKFNEISRHPMLKFIVLALSCYVAFAIGANNVANASAPIHSLLVNHFGLNSGSHYLTSMILATLIIAPCFALGSSIFSSRVLHTTGKEIISFGPMGAIAISFVTGTLLIAASLYQGIPTALAQLNVGAIIGLGAYKVGIKNVMRSTSVRRIFVIWIIAPIISFVLAYSMTMLVA